VAGWDTDWRGSAFAEYNDVMDIWEQVESIYYSRKRKVCAERALVLEAIGIASQVQQLGRDFALVVSASDAKRARAELESYDRESNEPVATVEEVHDRGGGSQGVMTFVCILLLVAIMVGQRTFGFDWFDAGMAKANLIRGGQWWRCVTALTLHSDVPHLAGNVLVGAIIGLLAGRIVGSGLGWLSIVVAGSAGNLLNAWIHGPDHRSVGASTAVFAALGIVAAHSWGRRQHVRMNKLYRWVPIVGGLVLLSFLGTGGEHTDVLAHGAGFVCGLVVGAVLGKWPIQFNFGSRMQAVFGGIALLVLTIAWGLALSS
jgi:membrane associated rhomboid family serine protease